MKITEKTWTEYIDRLARLNETAGQKMAEYIEKHGTADTETLISYAHALVQKYGEGSAELACQMYDSMAARSAADVPPAEPAAPASRREVEGMVKANQESPPQLQSGVSRFVKLAASDTTLKNASRDGAEFAWVPHGDTCAFCIMLASNGWKTAGRKTKRGTHAQHIHAHCNCEYAVRFDASTSVAGYDPERYLAQYADADGDLNAIRREHYAKHKDLINAQKRAAYAKRRALQAKRIEDAQREHEQKPKTRGIIKPKQEQKADTVANRPTVQYNKNGTVIVTDDWKEIEHPNIPSRYIPNAVVDTVSLAGAQHDRTIFGPDGRLLMQIHGGDHGHPKQHPYGRHGEHIHEYIWNEESKKPERTTREATDKERKQHADILGGVGNDS